MVCQRVNLCTAELHMSSSGWCMLCSCIASLSCCQSPTQIHHLHIRSTLSSTDSPWASADVRTSVDDQLAAPSTGSNRAISVAIHPIAALTTATTSARTCAPTQALPNLQYQSVASQRIIRPSFETRKISASHPSN